MNTITRILFVLGIFYLSKENVVMASANVPVNLELVTRNTTSLTMEGEDAARSASDLTFTQVECMYGTLNCSANLLIPSSAVLAPAQFSATDLTPGAAYEITLHPFVEDPSSVVPVTQTFCTVPLSPGVTASYDNLEPEVVTLNFNNENNAANVTNEVSFAGQMEVSVFPMDLVSDQITIPNVEYASLYNIAVITKDECDQSDNNEVKVTVMSGLPAPEDVTVLMFNEDRACSVWYYNQSMAAFDTIIATVGVEEEARSSVSADQEYGILCFDANLNNEFKLHVETTLSQNSINYTRASAGSSTVLSDPVIFDWKFAEIECESTCFIQTNLTESQDRLFTGEVEIGGASCTLDAVANMYMCEFNTVEVDGAPEFSWKICGEDGSCYERPTSFADAFGAFLSLYPAALLLSQLIQI